MIKDILESVLVFNFGEGVSLSFEELSDKLKGLINESTIPCIFYSPDFTWKAISDIIKIGHDAPGKESSGESKKILHSAIKRKLLEIQASNLWKYFIDKKIDFSKNNLKRLADFDVLAILLFNVHMGRKFGFFPYTASKKDVNNYISSNSKNYLEKEEEKDFEKLEYFLKRYKRLDIGKISVASFKFIFCVFIFFESTFALVGKYNIVGQIFEKALNNATTFRKNFNNKEPQAALNYITVTEEDDTENKKQFKKENALLQKYGFSRGLSNSAAQPRMNLLTRYIIIKVLSTTKLEFESKPFTKEISDEIWEKSNKICELCGEKIICKEHYEPDHIVLRSEGGNSTVENGRATHSWCNASRNLKKRRKKQ